MCEARTFLCADWFVCGLVFGHSSRYFCEDRPCGTPLQVAGIGGDTAARPMADAEVVVRWRCIVMERWSLPGTCCFIGAHSIGADAVMVLLSVFRVCGHSSGHGSMSRTAMCVVLCATTNNFTVAVFAFSPV